MPDLDRKAMVEEIQKFIVSAFHLSPAEITTINLSNGQGEKFTVTRFQIGGKDGIKVYVSEQKILIVENFIEALR